MRPSSGSWRRTGRPRPRSGSRSGSPFRMNSSNDWWLSASNSSRTVEKERNDKDFAAGRTSGDRDRGSDPPAAREPARAEPGVRSGVAHGERVRERPLWLGAVADVRRLGAELLGPGLRDLVGGEDDALQDC